MLESGLSVARARENDESHLTGHCCTALPDHRTMLCELVQRERQRDRSGPRARENSHRSWRVASRRMAHLGAGPVRHYVRAGQVQPDEGQVRLLPYARRRARTPRKVPFTGNPADRQGGVDSPPRGLPSGI